MSKLIPFPSLPRSPLYETFSVQSTTNHFLFLTSLAFTPLIVAYTIEILPYPMRAKGFNIFNFTISLALIFNQYVNPIALGEWLHDPS